MMRVEHWEDKLFEFIDSVESRPFKWGEHDCATFAAKCAQIITGSEHWPIADAYKDIRGARAAMGSKTLDELVDETGIRRLPSPAFAMRGDVVLFEGGNGPTLGVVIGPFFVAPGKDGLMHRPLLEAITAWRVEHA